MLKFLFFCLVTYALLKLLRVGLMYILRNQLKGVFPSDFKFAPGKSYFSIRKLQGKGEMMDIDIENLMFHMNIASIFGISKEPIFTFTVGKAFIFLNDNYRSSKLNDSEKSQDTFEIWTLKHFIAFIALEFFRRVHFSFCNILIKKSNFTLTLQEVLLLFKKQNKEIGCSFTVINFVISYNEPIFRIPFTQIDVSLNSYAMKHIFATLLSEFNFNIKSTNISMHGNEVDINILPVTANIDKNDKAKLELSFHPVKMVFLTSSIHTKDMNISIEDIRTSSRESRIGHILVKSLNKDIINIPNVKLNEADLVIPSIDMHLDIALMLDIAMILSLAPRTPVNPFKPKQIDIPFNANISKMTLFLELSDMHKYHINFMNAKTSRVTNSIRFSTASIYPIVEGTKIKLASAVNLCIHIISEVEFHFKAKEVIADCSQDYAILQYIKTSAQIFKFILNTYKGPKHVIPLNEPPTPFKVKFDFKKFVPGLYKKKITDGIERSIESKRIAMEGLCLRRARAIQMLEAKGIKTINIKNFEQKSKEILFNLYKSIYDDTKAEEKFCWVDMSDFKLEVDGFIFKNFEEAINSILEVYPNTNKDDIGIIDGAGIKWSFKRADFIASHYGAVLKLRDFKYNASMLLIPMKPTKVHHIYKLDIPCDNNSFNLTIPDITSSSVFLFKGDATSGKATIRYSPAFEEVLCDSDFNIRDAFLSLFEFKDIKSFDIYRIQYHLLGSFSIKSFKIRVTDAIRPFSEKPLLKFVIPNFKLEYHGEDFGIEFGSFTMMFVGNTSNQRFMKLPKLNGSIRFNSFNRINPNNTPPLFIDVDSRRVLDFKYDPFLQYRTSYYTVSIDFDFTKSGEAGLLNIDVMQSLVNVFMDTMSPRFSTFLGFIEESKDSLFFSGTNSTIKFPKMSIMAFNGTLNALATNFTLDLNFTNGDGDRNQNFNVSICNIDATMELLGQSCGIFALTGLNVSFQDDKSNIRVETMTTDMQPNLIKQLLQLDITFPEQKNVVENAIPQIINEETVDNLKNASKIMSLTVGKITFQLLDDANSFPPLISVDELSFSTFINENKEEIKELEFERFTILTSCYTKHPLIRSDHIKFDFAMSQKHIAVYVKALGSTEICVRPSDFDVVIPQLRTFMPDVMKSKIEKKSGTKISTNIGAEIPHSLIINFMMNDDSILALVMATGFVMRYVTEMDGSEYTDCSLSHLSVTDETISARTDPFHVAVRTNEMASKQFSMQIQKRKKTMKCPVFDNIHISLQPFYLNVSMAFIKSLTSFFPATLDLNIFDFDQTDLTEDNKGQYNQIYIGGSEKEDDDTEVVGFYRRVCVEEFTAHMCYRGLPENLIHEILDRDFDFAKIDLNDVFGTKEQLKDIVKRELKWNLIKAIPKLALKLK